MSRKSSAAARWRRLTRARFAELERLSNGEVRVGPAFWDERAEHWAAQAAQAPRRSPLLARVRRHVGRRTTVLDVGCGPGRHVLGIAPYAAEVVAVDVSRGMLDVVERAAAEQGLDNVRTVHGPWQEVEGVTADVSLCSNVLPVIADAEDFLRHLDAATRRRAFVLLGAGGSDLLMDPLWRHFHDRPRAPAPTYLDAVDVLSELGITPDVEVIEVPRTGRYETIDEAVDDYRRTLLLPDDREVREELTGLLSSWLVRRRDGYSSPARTAPAAILSWAPGR